MIVKFVDGMLYRRHEIKQGDQEPEFLEIVPGDHVNIVVGWAPIACEPEDAWVREGYANYRKTNPNPANGMYQLIGPSQGTDVAEHNLRPVDTTI